MCPSYIQDARFLKVKLNDIRNTTQRTNIIKVQRFNIIQNVGYFGFVNLKTKDGTNPIFYRQQQREEFCMK